jgi:hypothetical protein
VASVQVAHLRAFDADSRGAAGAGRALASVRRTFVPRLLLPTDNDLADRERAVTGILAELDYRSYSPQRQVMKMPVAGRDLWHCLAGRHKPLPSCFVRGSIECRRG